MARGAVVYATSSDNYIATQPPLDVNFGILGLPDDTTILYQNATGIRLDSYPIPHPSSTPPAAWPNHIEPVGEVLQMVVQWTQTDWNGKLKITFQTPDLTITVPEGSYSPPKFKQQCGSKYK